MIPHTVPNRPTNGAVAPTVARKFMKRSTRSISRPTVTFMTRSMRCCRLSRIVAVPSRPLEALRRHSRIAAAKTELIGSFGRWPTRSNRSSSEPPDQNVSSKLVAACCSRRMRRVLSKMTAHDQNEDRDDRLAIAPNLLVERQGRRADLLDAGLDSQHIVEPCRGSVIGRAAPHGEDNAGLLSDLAMRKAEIAHHLSAAALGEFK